MKPRIAPLAGAGLLALIGLNGWSLSSLVGGSLDDDQRAVEPIEWRPQLSISADERTAQKPIEDYPLTLAHPIFFKTRQPFVPPPPSPPPAPVKAAPAPPPAIVDPGLVLGGVMTIGHLRKAYLLTKTNPAGSWVAEGDNFMGWVIKSIGSSSAKVQQQDRTIELQLYPQDQDGSTPASEGSKGVMARAGPPALHPAPPTLAPLVTTAK
jgi:hypothetical protein